MKIFNKLFRGISLFFKGVEDILSGIISTALSAVITVAVLGGLAIVVIFVFRTGSSMLAGNF
ncbi:hypothetical protein PM10SUCC1_26650 [Propionigenium maris DSM 9537]|uniref:Uncharacterized protein n=1 Tax=Propionigenium maris DSM 9537 TaxID=1123000 RepID=A0A9W6LNB0_9FUSO|nr:hypothetical protein [Propionigenium maris]GLI57151.1 hypothetical protein PM10SUCC1_26650 [Propionigenium maris DSM 9537]